MAYFRWFQSLFHFLCCCFCYLCCTLIKNKKKIVENRWLQLTHRQTIKFEHIRMSNKQLILIVWCNLANVCVFSYFPLLFLFGQNVFNNNNNFGIVLANIRLLRAHINVYCICIWYNYNRVYPLSIFHIPIRTSYILVTEIDNLDNLLHWQGGLADNCCFKRTEHR